MADDHPNAEESPAAVTIGCLTQLLFPVGVLILFILFVKGSEWTANSLLPFCITGSWLAIGVSVFVFAPMAFLRPLRIAAGIGMVVSSYVVGITLWLLCLLYIFLEWGLAWMVGGLLFAGIGVVPLGFILSMFGRQWTLTWQTVVAVGVVYALRYGGLILTTGSKKESYSDPPPPPIFNEPPPSTVQEPKAEIVIDDNRFLPLCRHYDDGTEDITGAEEQIDIGLAAADEGDAPGALEAFRESVELDPEHPWARYNYGVFLTDLGNHAEALEQYKHLKLLDPHLARRLYDFIAEST